MNIQDKLYNEYKENLLKYNVKFPSKKSKMYYALIYLYSNIGKSCHIDDIRKFCVEKGIKLSGSDSIQIRHLGNQYGFNIIKSNEINPITKIKNKRSCYTLLDLKNKFPSFLNERRKITTNNGEWEILKQEYENKCATCGNEENKFCRYNKYLICILHKAHMDPRKELLISNLIPQCQECNQQYKNKFIFNKFGRIIKQIN